MSYYAISDIHGYFHEFVKLLNVIHFSNADTLVLCGDYIDRGNNCDGILKWLESKPKNVITIRGNHEEEFINNIMLMTYVNKSKKLDTDYLSCSDCLNLYDSVKYYLKISHSYDSFDYYSGILELINKGATLYGLICWANMFLDMPYYYKLPNSNIIFVHAGYIDNTNYNSIKMNYNNIEDFYLYSREDSYIYGGIPNGIIVSGHTPTVIKNQYCYTDGYIWHGYNKEINCHYYNIDTGCYLKEKTPSASLSCLRLDDKEEFYI